MRVNEKSAGGASTAPAMHGVGALAPLPVRDGSVTISRLIDIYMVRYAGKDPTRSQRLALWAERLGHLRLDELDDDHIRAVLSDLASRPGRYYAGKDADGRPVYKFKDKLVAPATVNRCAAALGALCTWAVHEGIPPKGWVSPVKAIKARTENNEIVCYLTDKEVKRLLAECQQSKWDRLYLFVLLAITTGARRGELEGLRWADVDLDNAVATLDTTKNGDRRMLVLLPNVVEELRRHVGPPSALLFASKRRPDIAYNHVPAWYEALKRAGIKDFRLHDCRHTCASHLAMNGATLLEIADVLGQRNLSVTKRYSHLTVGHKRALVGRVFGETK